VVNLWPSVCGLWFRPPAGSGPIVLGS
jgi:hypothetical protein